MDSPSEEEPAPTIQAELLYHHDGIHPTEISQRIGGSSPQAVALLAAFLMLFDFTGMSLLEALRFTSLGELQWSAAERKRGTRFPHTRLGRGMLSRDEIGKKPDVNRQDTCGKRMLGLCRDSTLP